MYILIERNIRRTIINKVEKNMKSTTQPGANFPLPLKDVV